MDANLPRRRTAAACAAAFALLAVACADEELPHAAATPSNPPQLEFQLQRPISPLTQPALESQAKAQLGKALFNDSRLSADGRVNCSSCHDLRAGGDDGRPVSVGVSGATTMFNAPTVLNSGLNFTQFWDGRARTLEEQIRATVESPVEMGGDWPTIERTLRADPEVAQRFAHLYEDGVTEVNVIDALAAYVRALVTWDSPFDRYLRGDAEAIDADAKAGFALFTRFGCVSCHQGRNVGGNLFQRFGVMGDYFASHGTITSADYGRFNVTGREEDRFKFKVPSLRNVASTAPYFHDGSATTLDEAVRVMVEYQLGRLVTSEQVAQLVAFLESLSGEVDDELL
jgi:cytochrome c peroxidase